jgi:hypothetical protein
MSETLDERFQFQPHPVMAGGESEDDAELSDAALRNDPGLADEANAGNVRQSFLCVFHDGLECVGLTFF